MRTGQKVARMGRFASALKLNQLKWRPSHERHCKSTEYASPLVMVALCLLRCKRPEKHLEKKWDMKNTTNQTESKMNLDLLCVNALRFLAVDAVQKANSGH